MNTRQAIPDWIKGIAITLMVYGHITHMGAFSAFQKQAVELVYTFHMPLFLMISGFFFKTSQPDWRSSTHKLVRRLIIPYLLFISLYLIGLTQISQIGIATSNHAPETPADFLKTILMQPIGAYWFIHSLVMIHLSFLAASIVANRRGLNDPTLIATWIFLLAVLCHFDLLTSRTALYFLLGVALARFGPALPASVGLGILISALSFILAKEEIFQFSLLQAGWCLGMLTTLAGVGRALEKRRIFFVLSWLGRNSLIVLLLHAAFIMLLKPTANLFLQLDQTGLVFSVMSTTLAVLGCLGAALLFDKANLSRRLFGTDRIYSNYSALSAMQNQLNVRTPPSHNRPAPL